MNIFVTVGTQLPFDRLMQTLEKWLNENTDTQVLAQTCGYRFRAPNVKNQDFLTPVEYETTLQNTDIIVAHAGMGTIITAHEKGIPIIVFPRRFDLKEHRNDHQLATANKFEDIDGVYVAYSQNDLLSYLDNMDKLKGCAKFDIPSRNELIENISLIIDEFIEKH